MRAPHGVFPVAVAACMVFPPPIGCKSQYRMRYDQSVIKRENWLPKRTAVALSAESIRQALLLAHMWQRDPRMCPPTLPSNHTCFASQDARYFLKPLVYAALLSPFRCLPVVGLDC